MSWRCVYIPSFAASKASAGALIQMASEMYRKAGEPEEVAVYHAFSEDGHHIFYFSPQSEVIFADLLKFFNASNCDRPRFLETLTHILGSLTPAEKG